VPHRAPGSPGPIPGSYLQGKTITYYRPRGSAEVRALVDHGFQAFNAGRLSEACHIFTDKMLAPEHDTTIGLTIAGALTPAGLGGCIIELMERGLVDFVISTGANLYHDLHYALNFTLHRGSPFLDDVELYEQGIIRIYDVLFPATVLLETDQYVRDFLTRPGLAGPMSSAEFHYRLGLDLLEKTPRLRGVLGARAGRARRRAHLHLVARRQLDRDERRVPRADERRDADDRSQPGRQRDLRHHPRGRRRTAA
jgi:deoxyhypusine synthase